MSNLFNPKIHLKNSLAQQLFEQEEVVIDGVSISLWRGHSANSINIQQTWNKIRSFAELNNNNTGVNGIIVFTGVMQIPRREAAKYAIKLGFNIRATVSHKSSFLVVGSENVSPSKVAKVIEYNSEGAEIHIIDEMSFLHLVQDNIDLIENFSKEENELYEHKYKNLEEEVLVEDTIENFPDLLQGMSFVVSGKFSMARDEIKKLIVQYGGKNVSAISAKTDYVLAGEKMGPAKLKKAEKLDIKVISEDEFMNLIEKN